MSAYKLRIGMLRLLDSAPVLIARDRGFFAAAGLDASVVIEPSWANIADKLAYGMLDAAVMLGPLALAMSLGLRGRATGLRLAATLSRNGNAIVLANHLAGRADLAAAIGAAPFAVVHAYSNHDLLLRDWLTARGVSPAAAAIVTLPPGDMQTALGRGSIAGFCAGAPWGARAARDGAGTLVATSAAIAPGHPEKLVVIRDEVAAANPMLAAALRDALGAATALCHLPAERAGLAAGLASPSHLDLPAELLADCLSGEGGDPLFMRGAELRPARADLQWTIARMHCAGHLVGIDLAVAERSLLRPVGEDGSTYD
ncbi:ABC transporter substrate-binding protein [Acidiphilium sp. PA]|uniref:ABC transporter substrate-binding protein n=1 Tax=Acidiphilium sp. PA TaxID=2871705 RepID=UPI002243E189|nr:ABC transporter substrate-binding protein [Acidiphilium sp. PA]MCW8308432.1 ABC transporter substrate-binding protein [Acidiphilium sp. PA]